MLNSIIYSIYNDIVLKIVVINSKNRKTDNAVLQHVGPMPEGGHRYSIYGNMY